MSENMTDKQMEVILNLVADKFSNCKNMEEVAKAVQEVRDMAKKETVSYTHLGAAVSDRADGTVGRMVCSKAGAACRGRGRKIAVAD